MDSPDFPFAVLLAAGVLGWYVRRAAKALEALADSLARLAHPQAFRDD